MPPDQFIRFYRFVFLICKEPKRKHVKVGRGHLFGSSFFSGKEEPDHLIGAHPPGPLIHYSSPPHRQVEIALQAWQLTLRGRFRLLDRWCEFIRSKGLAVQVVSEDQWGQVLDFSGTVHEDLSNFDPNGAWAWLLDEFVEHMRVVVAASR